MIGTCRLNNKNMRGIRRSEAYQCMAIDLAMLGVISREECEMLIGGGIPKNLQLPNGSSGNILSENSIPKQPVAAEEPTEPNNNEEPSDGEEPTEPDNSEEPSGAYIADEDVE